MGMPIESSKFSRRRAVQVLLSVGSGVAVGALVPSYAFAAEGDLQKRMPDTDVARPNGSPTGDFAVVDPAGTAFCRVRHFEMRQGMVAGLTMLLPDAAWHG